VIFFRAGADHRAKRAPLALRSALRGRRGVELRIKGNQITEGTRSLPHLCAKLSTILDCINLTVWLPCIVAAAREIGSLSLPHSGKLLGAVSPERPDEIGGGGEGQADGRNYVGCYRFPPFFSLGSTARIVFVPLSVLTSSIGCPSPARLSGKRPPSGAGAGSPRGSTYQRLRNPPRRSPSNPA
jgi:hypothetical protein